MAIVRTGRGPACSHEPGCPHDIGPAAAGFDGLSAMGRLSALRVPGIDSAAVPVGAGPIERRAETPQELAARIVREALETSLAATKQPAYRLVRAAERAPAPVTVEEAPVTTPAAPPLIPCGSCLHEPVCALKRELPADPATLAQPSILGPGLWLVPTSVTIRCDHHLEAIAASPSGRTIAIREPASAKRLTDESRERGSSTGRVLYAQRRAEKHALVIAQLRLHGGSAEAVGRAMGVTGSAVRLWIKRMATDGTLPADIAELVAARTRRAVGA